MIVSQRSPACYSTAVPESDEIVLRYFSCRGRAQPLRSALCDAGVAFVDHRVESRAWRSAARAPELTGLFAALPSLRWGAIEVCETLPIADLVSEMLGHNAGLSTERSLELAAVRSAMMMDVLVPIGFAIWADMVYPGADPVTSVARQLPRWLGKLERAAAFLPTTQPYLGGATPLVADFFVFEAFEAVRDLLGAAKLARLEQQLPRLARLRADLLQRPAVAACYQTRPPAFTGRPDESTVVARVHAAELF